MNVPEELARDSGLTGNARACYLLLLLFAIEGGRQSEDDGIRLPVIAEIAASFGCSVPSLRIYIRELKEACWIDTKSGGGKPTMYYLWDVPRRKENSTSPRAGASKSKSKEQELEIFPSGTSRDVSRSSNRKRDVVFDALVLATDSDLHLEGGKQFGKAAQALRTHPDHEGMPDEDLAALIHERAAMHRRSFVDQRTGRPLPCTHRSLLKHWLRLPALDTGVDVSDLPDPATAWEMLNKWREAGPPICRECNGSGEVKLEAAVETELEAEPSLSAEMKAYLERMRSARPTSTLCVACNGRGKAVSLDRLALPAVLIRTYDAIGAEQGFRTSGAGRLRDEFNATYKEFRRQELAGRTKGAVAR